MLARGGGSAALGMAARRIQEGQPRGGYDYLRRHRIVTRDPILAVLNFEMPPAA